MELVWCWEKLRDLWWPNQKVVMLKNQLWNLLPGLLKGSRAGTRTNLQNLPEGLGKTDWRDLTGDRDFETAQAPSGPWGGTELGRLGWRGGLYCSSVGTEAPGGR